MVQDQGAELATVKEDIQLIRDALTGHVAKEDVVYEIFKRVMNTGNVEAPPSENDKGVRSARRSQATSAIKERLDLHHYACLGPR